VKDAKVIVAWNGWLATALLQASLNLQDRPALSRRLLLSAERSLVYLVSLADEKKNLPRTVYDAAKKGAGYLEDYVALAEALQYLAIRKSDAAPAEVASSLQLSKGTRVLHFERLRLASDQPIALMRNFVPLSLEEVVTEEGLKSAGLYQLLRQNGIHLRLASQTIGARSAQRREARLLKVPAGAPLLTMRRISYDDAGQPVEYGSHVYPAERYSFEMSVVADSRT